MSYFFCGVGVPTSNDVPRRRTIQAPRHPTRAETPRAHARREKFLNDSAHLAGFALANNLKGVTFQMADTGVPRITVLRNRRA